MLIDNAKTIFLNALELSSSEARHAYLGAQCGNDPSLRAEVEELLRHHAKIGPLGESASIVGTTPPPSIERPGTQIGPYKLLQQIGEGGMGTVYLAEQTEPVQRQVALKIIKPGMDSRQIIARFEAERQALAMMDHVNIARVLDAGTTQVGRPYFVMELVRGVSITKYCDDNHLTPRQRLELFVPVCQAIQHAHQKGIIHRDIKPSNVMVTLYDGKPVPKVIDFGVAKATEQKLTEQTLFTQYGTLVGTLEYMSPEQAEISALGVDTRSDIYSLGVLLYELLTGSTPLSSKRMKEIAYAEILRLIKEEEPPKPSTRLSDSGEALASISAQRHMEPAKLAKLLRGELDWIVMKALDKDRDRRYETANGFALDIQRHLTDEPVTACPPSAGYRLLKFARRNKGPVLAAALVLLALVAGVVGTTFGLIEARRERDVAEVARGRAIQAQQRETERATGERQAKQAALGAAEAERDAKEAETKQRVIAEQETARAERYYGMAREVVDDLLVSVGEELAFKQPGLQSLRKQLFDRALTYYQSMVELQDDDPKAIADLAANHVRIARIKGIRGPITDAIDHYEKAVVLFDKLARTEPETMKHQEELISALNSRGALLQANARYEDARQSFDRAISVSEQLLRDHPDAVAIENALARSYNNRGWHASEAAAGSLRQRAEQALPYHQKARAIWERLARENPNASALESSLSAVYSNIANRKLDTSRPEEALELFQNRLAIQQKLAERHPKVFGVQMDLGTAYVTMADVYRRFPKQFDDWFQRAVESYSKGREILERLAPDNATNLVLTRNLARTYLAMARVYRMHNDLADARLWIERSVELREQWLQVDPGNVDAHAYVSGGHDERGRILELANSHDEAAQAYQRAIDVARQTIEMAPQAQRFRDELRNYEASLARVLNNLAWRLTTDSDPERRDANRAVELAKRAVELAPKDGNYCNTLGVAHYRAGDWAAAVMALEKSVEILKGGNGFDWFFLAMAHWQLDEKEKSRSWFDKAVEWMDKNKPNDEELRRFRAEATTLLKIEGKPIPE